VTASTHRDLGSGLGRRGERLQPELLEKVALRAAGVPCGRYENGMHDLRHFFASVLLDQGESIKAVAEWLGHTDPSFTLKIYTHLMPSSADWTKSVIEGIYRRREVGSPHLSSGLAGTNLDR
jgi:integrase